MFRSVASEAQPDQRQDSVLCLLAAAGGYFEGAFADGEALGECIDRGWIVPEGNVGHALTVEGRLALNGGDQRRRPR